MAALGSTYLDIIDFAKQSEDGDKVAAVIEVLKQQNSILDDAIAVECNMGTTHRHTIRTGLPTPAWGLLYQGVAQSKSRYQQVDDTTGFLESMSGVDTRILKLNPGKEAQVRLNEAEGHLEGMNQEMATGLFYHDTASAPEKFKGLSPRYSSSTTGNSSSQVIKAGGAGSDNTSIWIVTWSDRATHLLYPKGTQGGVIREDMGTQRVLDGSSNPYFVEEEKFTWHMGVAVKDWRYNARICNIDVSEMQAGNVDLYKWLRRAYYKLASRPRRADANDGGSPVRQAIYCNRDVLEALEALSVNKGATDSFVRLTPQEIEGREVMTYRGIPIRECDAILNTETAVS